MDDSSTEAEMVAIMDDDSKVLERENEQLAEEVQRLENVCKELYEFRRRAVTAERMQSIAENEVERLKVLHDDQAKRIDYLSGELQAAKLKNARPPEVEAASMSSINTSSEGDEPVRLWKLIPQDIRHHLSEYAITEEGRRSASGQAVIKLKKLMLSLDHQRSKFLIYMDNDDDSTLSLHQTISPEELKKDAATDCEGLYVPSYNIDRTPQHSSQDSLFVTSYLNDTSKLSPRDLQLLQEIVEAGKASDELANQVFSAITRHKETADASVQADELNLKELMVQNQFNLRTVTQLRADLLKKSDYIDRLLDEKEAYEAAFLSFDDREKKLQEETEALNDELQNEVMKRKSCEEELQAAQLGRTHYENRGQERNQMGDTSKLSPRDTLSEAGKVSDDLTNQVYSAVPRHKEAVDASVQADELNIAALLQQSELDLQTIAELRAELLKKADNIQRLINEKAAYEAALVSFDEGEKRLDEDYAAISDQLQNELLRRKSCEDELQAAQLSKAYYENRKQEINIIVDRLVDDRKKVMISIQRLQKSNFEREKFILELHKKIDALQKYIDVKPSVSAKIKAKINDINAELSQRPRIKNRSADY